MSTAHPAPPTPPAAQAPSREIIIYSHCGLFYWWPVWAAGFVMSIVTAFSGQVLAVVPAHSKPEVGRKLEWLAGDDLRTAAMRLESTHRSYQHNAVRLEAAITALYVAEFFEAHVSSKTGLGNDESFGTGELQREVGFHGGAHVGRAMRINIESAIG